MPLCRPPTHAVPAGEMFQAYYECAEDAQEAFHASGGAAASPS